MRALPLVAVFVLAPLSNAIAQQQPLQAGQRVRVTAPTLGIRKQAATFEALRGDTLIVVADSIMDCPLASVTRLDVSRGRRSNALKGLGFGAAAGAVIGAAVGAWGAHRDTPTSEAVFCYEGTAACAAGGALAVGAFGGLVGLGVGALAKTDRWEELPLDRLRVSVVPRRDGFGVGARIAF